MNSQPNFTGETNHGLSSHWSHQVENSGIALLARQLASRLRNGWERFRPLPLPRYVVGTPRTGTGHPLDPFFPPNIPTLANAATSREAADFVVKLLETLSVCNETSGQQLFYRWAVDKFGRYWHDADIMTLLWAAATLGRPNNYLEIGVRRGRSAAVVAAIRSECAIYGFDLWVAGYAGDENPGPSFVRNEIRAVRHRGHVELISGDSRKTVSAFLQHHPELYFDLITVDGDHSVIGAAADFANVLPRLKVGGIIVCDDVCLPSVQRVWEKIIKQDSRYVSWDYTYSAYGVAAAIRISDEPALAMRP